MVHAEFAYAAGLGDVPARHFELGDSARFHCVCLAVLLKIDGKHTKSLKIRSVIGKGKERNALMKGK